MPLRTIVKEKCESTIHQLKPNSSQMISHQKKYSVKLQSNEKENIGRKKEAYDMTIVRPFQETNRYLET